MSTAHVLAFMNETDRDAALRSAVEATRGSDAIVDLAADRGFEFTREELDPVVSLLAFVRAIASDEELQKAASRLTNDAQVVDLARTWGYDFTPETLRYVAFVPVREGELDEAELEAVAGGATTLGPRIRVQIHASVGGQTPRTDFGAVLKAGALNTMDASASGASLAAPFIPGGSVVSAAISGMAQTKESGGA